MKRIRTVIFDLDDTLYSYTKTDPIAKEALYRYCEEQRLMTREEAAAIHKEMAQEQAVRLGSCAASHNRLIRYQMILEAKGLPLFPHAVRMEELYWNTLLLAAEPEPGIVALFQEPRRLEIKIGVGTNMTARVQFEKLEHLGLAPYVDFVTTSEEAGVEKPDPVLFQRCVQKVGCQASECVFIGDSVAHDIAGALDAGLNPVLYQPKWKKPAVPSPGVPVIGDYRDCLQEDAIHLGTFRIGKDLTE